MKLLQSVEPKAHANRWYQRLEFRERHENTKTRIRLPAAADVKQLPPAASYSERTAAPPPLVR